ncbi:MAG: hypothetical protein ACYC26_11060 [Phycisphaerales bacterium]
MYSATKKMLELSRRLLSWAMYAIALVCGLCVAGLGLVGVGAPLVLAMMIAPAKPKAQKSPGLLVLMMNKAKEAMKEKQPRPEGAGAAEDGSDVVGYVGHQGISPPDDDAQRP